MTQQLKSENLQFGEPLLKEVLTPNNERCFYLQDIQHHNQNFYIQSDWFVSDPPKVNAYNKAEILVKNTSDIKDILQFIVDAAAVNAQLPNEDVYSEAKEKKDLFRPIPNTDYIYVKIDKGIQCFDRFCKPISYESLSFGRYRAIIHVKCMYYGRHGEEPYKASLVLKVVQLQYEKQSVPCLFYDTTQSLVNELVSHPPLATSTPIKEDSATNPSTATSDGKKKRGRRPRLQRQNAMTEGDVTAVAVNVDEIFQDLGI